MTVSHAPKGYTGTVDEVAWAKLMGLASARFRVASSTDWAVSVSGTTNRTINVAAGAGYACGVYDSTTAQDTVAFGANAGGSNRYDALLATWTWGSDTVAFRALAGTTSPPAINTTTTVDNAKINRIPGVQYDALLAIVQVRPGVGLFTSGDLFDCRPYGGLPGSLTVATGAYKTVLDVNPGTQIYTVDAKLVWYWNGTSWNVANWLGTDRSSAGLPGIGLTFGSASINNNTSTAITGWTTVAGPPSVHSGLVSYAGSQYIKALAPGRMRVSGYAFSDTVQAGSSILTLTGPAVGVMANLAVDRRHRASAGGYGGSQTLEQWLDLVLTVQPNDQIGMSVYQLNPASVAVTYNLNLQAYYL